MNDREKLKALLEHWIGHTRSHVDSYRQWADRMRQSGLNDVADSLEAVAEGEAALEDSFKAALEQLRRHIEQ